MPSWRLERLLWSELDGIQEGPGRFGMPASNSWSHRQRGIQRDPSRLHPRCECPWRRSRRGPRSCCWPDRRSCSSSFLATGVCAGLGLAIGSAGVAPRASGYVYVFSEETDVEVSIGGRTVGRVPIHRLSLKPGIHEVVGAKGGRVDRVRIKVEAGENRVVRLMFPVERQ